MSLQQSVTAARIHIASLWNSLLKTRLPNTWVPVPIKRALLEAITVSLHSLLVGSVGKTIPRKNVVKTLELLGFSRDEIEPRKHESIADWYARLAAQKPDETASEWIERVSRISLAFMVYIVTIRFTPEMMEGAGELEETTDIDKLLRERL